MQNFIIDTSVFALSGKSEDANIEKNNLCMLKNNIIYLKKLQYNNSITVSYMNWISQRLKKNNYLIKKTEINSRIEELIKKNPGYQSEIWLDSDIFNNWDEFLIELSPKRDAYKNSFFKGKIGIFNNIPGRYSDPPESYIKTTNLAKAGSKKIYPKLPYDFLNTFKKYCGYIADLNFKYHCFDNNFIVLGEGSGMLENKSYKIILNKSKNYIDSRVSIVGIQRTEALCPQKLKFININMITACEEAIKKFSEKLYFGKDINNYNIQQDLLPIAGPPETIYRYLETLHHVSELIVKENINIHDEDETELVELLNSYGLLCSPEDDKYAKNKCKYRKFLNKLEEKQFFNIHLKPATYNNNPPDEDGSNYTLGGAKGSVRIYLYWDNGEKKFVLGWIGHHPLSCKNCDNKTCQGYLVKQ
jgi:hypothetical protein